MFDLIVHGGTVISAGGERRANLAIAGGIIKAVTAPGEQIAGRQEIDANNKMILPGLVDAHVHIPGYLLSERLDDFRSATTAAAVGGVTTIMLMPTDDPRITTASSLERKRKIGEQQSFVDFAIQALIGPRTEHAEIADIAAAGAISFELFLAYGGNPDFVVGHDDFALQRLMRLVTHVGGTAGVTPHSASLISKLTELQREHPLGRTSLGPGRSDADLSPVQRFAATRPTLSEGLGIARACTVASETGTRIHLRSLSCQKSIDLVRCFRDCVALSSEVMSHHLLFSEEQAAGFGPYGIIVPPIRAASERANLRMALRAGDIDMVVSDHSPVLREDKEIGWADIWRTPPGMPGLQTLYPSMLVLVDEGALSLSDVARTCAERPAVCFGLHPRKGALVAGSDADFVILDPTQPTLIEDSQQLSKANYTTLKGRAISSRIDSVYLRGNLVAAHGRTVGSPAGRFVRP
jgi:dihydroorotase